MYEFPLRLLTKLSIFLSYVDFNKKGSRLQKYPNDESQEHKKDG